MPRFKKKPIVIEAIQWDGTDETKALIEKIFNTKTETKKNWLNKSEDLVIKTLEGEMTGIKGDWIIQGIDKEVYPCKAAIFEKTYDKIGD